MAAVIPDKRLEQVQFCENHIPVWTAAPATAIGLTAGQITALNAATSAARDAYNAQQAAKDAAKAATTDYYTKVATMRDLAADLVRTIKSFAELQTSPGTVYALAQIPTPQPPAPLPAPGKPENFLITLQTGGALTISWTAENAAASTGAFYTISRKLPGETTFNMLGGTSGSTTENRRMSFTDTTVPSSAAGAGVQYKVRGQRGAVYGPESEGITIEFGVDGAGASFARVSGQTGGPTIQNLRSAA